MLTTSVRVGRTSGQVARSAADLVGLSDAVTATTGGGGFELSRQWFESNTGCPIPKGELTPWTGSSQLTTPNALYEGYLFTDSMWLQAPGARFRNCWSQAGPYGFIDGWDDNASEWLSRGATFENMTFECGEWTNAALLLRGQGWSTSYVEIFGGQDGMKPGGTWRHYRTFIHDLSNVNPDDHNDAIQVLDTVRGDVDESWYESHNTACIAAFGGQGAYGTIATSRSYHGGGAGYLFYAGGESIELFSATDCLLGQWGFGPAAHLPPAPHYVWSNNISEATGLPVGPDGLPV